MRFTVQVQHKIILLPTQQKMYAFLSKKKNEKLITSIKVKKINTGKKLHIRTYGVRKEGVEKLVFKGIKK